MNMNREIKFRAWDKTYKCWYEPTHRAYEGKLWDLMVGFSGDLLAHSLRFGKDEVIHQSMFPNRYELMQYTGLKDKNGKEIYEGDIINDDGLIMTIEFIHASFCKCNDKGNWIIHSHDRIEVIGNIYENPELLK